MVLVQYDDVTSVYDDVTYDDVTEILVFIGTCSVTTGPVSAFTRECVHLGGWVGMGVKAENEYGCQYCTACYSR